MYRLHLGLESIIFTAQRSFHLAIVSRSVGLPGFRFSFFEQNQSVFVLLPQGTQLPLQRLVRSEERSAGRRGR